MTIVIVNGRAFVGTLGSENAASLVLEDARMYEESVYRTILHTGFNLDKPYRFISVGDILFFKANIEALKEMV